MWPQKRQPIRVVSLKHPKTSAVIDYDHESHFIRIQGSTTLDTLISMTLFFLALLCVVRVSLFFSCSFPVFSVTIGLCISSFVRKKNKKKAHIVIADQRMSNGSVKWAELNQTIHTQYTKSKLHLRMKEKDRMVTPTQSSQACQHLNE